jgi:hypothetical protein
MWRQNTARSRIFNATSYEHKLLVLGFLLPALLALFFVYIIISIMDVERSGIYNSVPSAIVLVVGTVVSLKLLFFTKLEKIEFRRFRFVFLSMMCWLAGEVIYAYHQAFLGVAVPYPSIADAFYLSATLFLSIHLYIILYLKRNISMSKGFLFLGFIASTFPMYFLLDAVYHYEDYYQNNLTEFIVNALYFATDAVVIFPCIPILFSLRKNDPFKFHWFLIALSVLVLVTVDQVYTFIASVNEDLLTTIEWLLSFIYSIGYLLLSTSIVWFDKIKEILEYKKFSDRLRYARENDLDINDHENEFKETLDGSNKALENMLSISEKAKEQLDILFTQYVIQKRDIIQLVNALVKMTRKNKLLNIRILLPSPKLDEAVVTSNMSSRLLIKYFDRQLSSNTVTSILDSEVMYVVGSDSGKIGNSDRFFMREVINEPKIHVSVALFERMWMLEKSVDFE